MICLYLPRISERRKNYTAPLISFTHLHDLHVISPQTTITFQTENHVVDVVLKGLFLENEN